MDGDVSNALEALKANPENLDAVADLVRAADKVGADSGWEDAAKIYETALKTARRGVELRLLAIVGDVYATRLNDKNRAEGVFRKVRKIDARDSAALDFYRAYYKERNELPQLLNVLQQAQRAEEDEEARLALGIEMAQVAEQNPQTMEKAIDLWKGVLRKKPELQVAQSSLELLYTETEKWNALTELLKERVDHLGEEAVDAKIALYLQMIPIYRDKMHLEVMVTNYYQAILKLKPDHRASLEALAESYESKARYPDLVTVLTRLAEIAAQPADAIVLYQRVATLWSERLGKPQNAAAALEKVLQMRPGDTDAHDALVALYTKGRKWRELLEIYKAQTPLSDKDKERERLVEMARLANDRLSDPKQAIEIWNQVLVVDATDAEALPALATLYERNKDWALLAETLGKQVDAADEQATKLSLLERQGTLLHEKADDAAGARRAFEALRVLAPDHSKAFRLLREIYTKQADVEALERLFTERGAYDDLCEALIELGEKLGDDKAAPLFERVATIAIEKLKQPERAIKAYERIVAIDPSNSVATDALEGLYGQTQKWSRLLENYELRLGGNAETDAKDAAAEEGGKKKKKRKKAAELSVKEQLEIMGEARKLCEDQLGSKSEALKWALRAQVLAPADAELFVEVERLAEASESWSALADLYHGALERLGGLAKDAKADEKLPIVRKSLKVATTRTKRPAEARKLADALLELSPGDPEAESALQAILSTEEKWPEVVELMQRREKRITDEGEKAELLVGLARIQEEKLGQPDAAIASLRRALSLNAKPGKVLATLARLYENAADYAGLADVFARQADAETDSDAKAAVLLRLGRLQEQQIKDGKAARAAYLAVLEIDIDSADAVAGLERALFDGSMEREEIPPVAQRLARYYETTERFDKWAESLEALVSATPDETARLKHLEILTGLYEDAIGDKGEAYGAALRVFEIAPQNAPNRERLLRLAKEAARLDDLARGIDQVLVVADDPELRVQLLTHLADIEEAQSGHGAQAEKAYRQIIEIEPLHINAHSALTRLLRDGERWQDLRGVLEKREGNLPGAEEKEKISLLAQIAEIDESLLGDREHAVATLMRQLELQPTNRSIFHSLERLLTALGRWSTLAKTLTQESDLAPESERETISFKRIEILVEKLGNFDEALDILEERLKATPDNENVLRMVERMLRKPKAKQRAANILGPIYNKQSKWEGLVEVLQIRRSALTGPKAMAALKKVAELQELKLADEPGALTTWQTILEMDPRNTEAMQSVERLIAMLERPGDLVQLYRDMAEKKDEDDLRGRAELYVRAARLSVSSLGDREQAALLWQKVLDLDPTSAEIGRPAAEALEALYPQIGAYEKLVEILKIKVEWEKNAVAKAAVYVRIADLRERALKDSTGALENLREAFDLQPDDIKLLDRLEPIYQAASDWPHLIEILERRLALATSKKSRVALRWRIAAIHDEKLNDLDQAIAMVQANLDEAGGEKAALDALDKLYEKSGAHESRLGTLERRLVLTDVPTERVLFLRKAGGLLAGPLEQPREAIEKWREILLHIPDDSETIVQIEALLGREDELGREAAEILEPIYEIRENWPEMARILAIYIETESDRRNRMKTWTRLGELRRDQLGDTAGAFSAIGNAIRDAIGEESLIGLLDTYDALGNALGRSADVIELYKEIEPDVLREEVKLRIERRIATVAIESGDLESARDRFLSILDQSPSDSGALLGLDRIYRERNDDAQLYELLMRRAELVFDDGIAEFPLRSEAGAVALKLDRVEDAIAAYGRALELRQQDEATVMALQSLYEKAERWVDLRELLERRLLMVSAPAELIAIRERMARIEIDELGDRGEAIEHLKEILRREADHPAAIEMAELLLGDVDIALAAADLLDPVYTRRSAWDKLVHVHEVRRDQLELPAEKVVWTRRIARLFEEQIEDLTQAFEWYGKLFAEVPSDKAVQEQLLRLAPKLDKWPRLAEIIEDYLYDESSDTDEVLSVVRLAAWIQDERLADRDAARKHYRRNLDALPDDPAAVTLFEKALERWEAWEELRDLIDDQAIRANSTSQRVALMKRSARISEIRLEDRGRAADCLRTALDEAPDDKEAASERERLLRTDARWDDVADHLRWRMETESDAGARQSVALRLAGLMQLELGDIGSAIELFEEILGGDPAQADARKALEGLLTDEDHRVRVAAVLEPAFRQTQTLDRLAAVLRIRIENADDSGERMMLLQEAASLEEQLGNVGEALEARGRVWLEDVANDGALASLEAAVPSARAFDRFVALLLEGAGRADDPQLRASLLGKAAQVVESSLNDRKRAITIWKDAVDAQPENDGAYRALERLLETEGKFAELVAILERHCENVFEPAVRGALWKRIATLNEHSLKNADNAIEAWKAVLDNDEADPDALDALARLFAAAERWKDLSEIFQRKIELASSRDPAAVRMLRFAAARLYDDKLREPTEATAQLRSILDANSADGDALLSLDQIYAREKQHAELLEIVDIRAQNAPSPADRLALAFRAAQLLANELDDTNGAIDRYRQILDQSAVFKPARDALWALAQSESYRMAAVSVLEPLLRAGGNAGELVDILELKLAGEDAGSNRITLLVEMANIEESARGDLVRAFEFWTRAFNEDPADETVRESLERVAQARGDFRKLSAIYEKTLSDTYDSALQTTLALRLAGLAEQQLRDPDKALGFLKQAAEFGGEDPDILQRMSTLLRQRARFPELADVIARQSAAADSPAMQSDFLSELGKVRLENLADRRGAFEAFRDALERAPEHAVALPSLRTLMRVDELKTDIVEVLEPLADARGDFKELAALYEVRAGMQKNPVDAASWWQKVAETVEQRLGDLPAALDAYGKALPGDPENAEIIESLSRVAEASNKHLQGARLLEASLGQVEGSGLVTLAERAARLYELANTPDALLSAERLYRKILEQDSENQSALAAIEALYRKRGDREGLAKILERRAETELDSYQQAALRGEAAALYEQRGDLKSAVRNWEAAHEADDAAVPPIDALIRLYEHDGNHERLVAVLEDRARLVDDPAGKVALYVRIAEIRATALDDADGAALALREAIDIDPDSLVAFEALVALQESRESWNDLEDALLQRVDRSTPAERRTLLFRLTNNARKHLNDADRAMGYLRQILDDDSGDSEASETMETLLASAERWHDLIDLLEARSNTLKARGDKEGERKGRLRIAEIWAEKLDNLGGACEAVEEILKSEPGHLASLITLGGLYAQSERHDEAIAALERAASAGPTGRMAADLHYKMAQILIAQEAPTEKVEERYLMAVDADRTHRNALLGLESLSRKAGDHAQLVQVLGFLERYAEDDEERVSRLKEMVALYSGPLGAPQDAMPSLERLVALAPDDAEAQEAFGSVLLKQGKLAEGSKILAELVDVYTRKRQMKAVARIHATLGQAAESRGDLPAALEHLKGAFKVEPSSPLVLAVLGRVAQKAGDSAQSMRCYRALLLQTFDEGAIGVTKADVYFALGKLHVEAGEAPKARSMFERGLESAPERADIKAALATVK
jgi:golgin subfamily B member 1